jgi:cytosine/uracil/thiamine/allantoin permease
MTEIRDHAIAYNVEHRGPAGADWNIPFPGLTRKFWGEVQTPVLLKLFIPSMSCYFIGLLVFNPNHDELSIKLHGSVFRTKPL